MMPTVIVKSSNGSTIATERLEHGTRSSLNLMAEIEEHLAELLFDAQPDVPVTFTITVIH